MNKKRRGTAVFSLKKKQKQKTEKKEQKWNNNKMRATGSPPYCEGLSLSHFIYSRTWNHLKFFFFLERYFRALFFFLPLICAYIRVGVLLFSPPSSHFPNPPTYVLLHTHTRVDGGWRKNRGETKMMMMMMTYPSHFTTPLASAPSEDPRPSWVNFAPARRPV